MTPHACAPSFGAAKKENASVIDIKEQGPSKYHMVIYTLLEMLP